MVFGQLAMIPNIMERVVSALPESYKQVLEKKDTIFFKIASAVSASGGTAAAKDLIIEAEGFTARFDASVDLFEATIVLSPALTVSADLSQSLIAGVEELGYFADEKKQIRIPLTRYQGPLESVRVYPDVPAIGKILFEKRGKDELKKAIFKVLDIPSDVPQDGPSSIPEGSGREQPPSTNQELNPEKVLLQNVLDAVFGK